VNDRPEQARALARLLDGLLVHVNMIPFNPWPGSGFASTPRTGLRLFQEELLRAGVSTSVRFSRGRDTGGACGQLALRDGGASDAAPVGYPPRSEALPLA
jgi:23S rRNA (adenine2503-C2)-methyltransferase